MGSAVGRAVGRQDTISKEKLGGRFAASGYRVLRNTAVPHFYSGPLRINAILFVFMYSKKKCLWAIQFSFVSLDLKQHLFVL